MFGKAQIVCNYRIAPDGKGETTYRWDGPKDGIAFANIIEVAHSKRDGNVLTLGGLRLCIVYILPEYGGAWVMQDGWRARAYRVLYRLGRLANKVYFSLIYIAWVLGLADHIPGTVPTWREVRMLRWVAERMKR